MKKRIVKTMPEKIKKQHFVISDANFKRTVHCFVNYSHDEFTKFARKKGATDYEDDPEYENNFAGFSTVISAKNAPDEFVIVLKKFDWCISDQGTLIHEITHTVMKIFASNNIPFNLDTQEFIAHAIGNMYEDFVRKLLVVKK